MIVPPPLGRSGRCRNPGVVRLRQVAQGTLQLAAVDDPKHDDQIVPADSVDGSVIADPQALGRDVESREHLHGVAPREGVFFEGAELLEHAGGDVAGENLEVLRRARGELNDVLGHVPCPSSP
jgi:hypothetical protein